MKKFDFNTKLSEELIETNQYKYIKYPFEKFNKVQSLIVKNKYYEKDFNVILATNTSTGKTICSELFIGQTLYKQKKKIVYVSPLKSLTQEKYDDWKDKFSDKKICILTSDFSDDSKILSKLKNSDIICLTSEMLDSKTRSIKNLLKWGNRVGLIVIDEFHILDMEARGHAVESGLMRFCKYCNNVRLMCLSATVPNTEDFRKWLTNLNKKTTLVIKSNWRPVKLDFHYVKLNFSVNEYSLHTKEKIQTTFSIVTNKPDEKFLCFVHDKNTGRKLTKFLNDKGVQCNFHSAELNFKKRMTLEKDFSDKDNGSRVLVSTSTLAWGRSLPARNVVIVGSTRGINMVDEFDILQMAGRAGRLGLDDKGDCYFLTHNVKMWKSLLKNLKEVNSTLIEQDYLQFQILAEIAMGNVYDLNSLEDWYNKSLAYVQNKGNTSDFQQCLTTLQNYGMIDVINNSIEIKSLGKVSAYLYFLPKDIISLKNKLKKIKMLYNNYTLSYLLGFKQSWSIPYIPKEIASEVSIFMNQLKLYVNNLDKKCITTCNLFKYFENGETNSFNFQAVKDLKRIDSALQWISSIFQVEYPSLYSD